MTATRTCEHCAGDMPLMARAHARYCKPACRAAAARARRATAVPAVDYPERMKRAARWVRRNARKVPLTVDGAPARANEPATWSDFDAAAASSAGNGLGYVLAGDGVTCIDLDHCIAADGTLSAEAEALLSTLPETYVEVSMSGDGLHVFGTGLYISSRKIRRAGLAGEVIASRKYVAVTGNRFRNAPLTLANIAAPARELIR